MKTCRLVHFAAVLLSLLSATVLQAQVPTRDQIPAPDPELERATFRVPEGFEVSLYAADPAIAKPIQMNFDEDGRLWIASSEVYPQITPGAPATDRILVVEDTDHDGRADQTHVFAEGLLIPTGVAPGDGGVWVANSTELLHFADTDGDLKADSRRVVLSGFGTEDTHHILHTLRWGYDGFLYMNQSIYIHSHIETPWGVRRLNAGGIWQFRPETLELGVFMRGLVNTWGHHFDRFGQSFATDGAGGEGINYVIPGAYYFTAANAERLVRGLNPGSPKHCGLQLVDTPMLPPEWQGNAITNDFRGHRVVRFVLTEEASGYVSREQQEVIWSDHVAFRPIDVKIGPDGAIYIADWYNPIIQHGEVDFRDDRRDHTHGRIWRVTWKGAPQREHRAMSDRTNVELFESLRSDDGIERQSAKQLLRQRGPEIAAELQQWLGRVQLTDAERDPVLLEALWCFQTARQIHPELLNTLLGSADGRIRAAAVRVLSHWKYLIPDSRQLLTERIQDVHPRVRLEAVRALSFSPLEDSERQIADGSAFPGETLPASAATVAEYSDPRLIETALKPLQQPLDGNLDYAMWLTSKELASSWQPAFAEGRMNFGNDADQVAFAFAAVGAGAPVELLMRDLYHADLTADKRARLVRLISGSADAGQLGRLVSAAAGAGDTATIQSVLEGSVLRKLTPDVSAADLGNLLDSEDDLLRRVGLTAAAQWRPAEFLPQLQAILSAGDSAADDVAAVLAGVSASQHAALIDTIAGVAGKAGGIHRVELLETLALVRPGRSAELIAAMLTQLKPAETEAARRVTQALLQAKNGSTLLRDSLKDRSMQTDVALEVMRVLRESGRTDAELETLLRAAGKVPTRRSLTAEQRAALLRQVAETASAGRGERVFRNERLGCLKCHAIGNAGGLVGPDMISLGASAQPDYLLESLLDPNAKVKENYHTTVVATIEGRVLAGVQIARSEKSVTLRTAENVVVEIPADQIEDTAQGVSLMPEGLVDALTDGEIADLVRFLSELGRTPEYTLSRTRMVRSWGAVLPTRDAFYRINRSSVSQVATNDPSFTFAPKYSRVNGELPLEDLPILTVRDTQLSFARTTLRVTSPGNVGFLLNSTTGVEIRIDGVPMPPETQFSTQLSPGLHTVTATINREQRTDPLQISLQEEVVGQAANVELVN